MTTEKYVKLYGEKYRRLIADSLSWLEERKHVWGLPDFDTHGFIQGLIDSAKIKRESGFYWVRFNEDDDLEIAHFYSNSETWLIPGSYDPHSEEDFWFISDRIEEPNEGE